MATCRSWRNSLCSGTFWIAFQRPSRFCNREPFCNRDQAPWSDIKKCGREGSNLHSLKREQDPQSCASANSATSAIFYSETTCVGFRGLQDRLISNPFPSRQNHDAEADAPRGM